MPRLQLKSRKKPVFDEYGPIQAGLTVKEDSIGTRQFYNGFR